jgi:hypothetical protein
VKTIEDVETKLVSLMTSRLRKGLGLAGNIAKSMIKTSLKIDIDGIFKSDNAETAGNSKIHSILDAFEKMELSLDIDPSKVSFNGSKSKDKPLFIVFDDLERVDMDVTVILGYINNLTEHSNVHVVILADEEKLLNPKTTSEFQHSYADVKEKLIGITFEVQHNLKGMFEDFVTPVNDKDVQLDIRQKSATNSLDFDTLINEQEESSKWQNIIANNLNRQQLSRSTKKQRDKALAASLKP